MQELDDGLRGDRVRAAGQCDREPPGYRLVARQRGERRRGRSVVVEVVDAN